MSKFWSSGGSSSSSSSSSDTNDNDNDNGEGGFSDSSNEASSESLSCDPNLAWDAIKEKQKFVKPIESSNEKPPDCTRVVLISDTHSKHREVCLPPGDILIHGGDFTKSGEPGSIADLDEFFGESKFEEIICIAGNHDLVLAKAYYENNWNRFHRKKFSCPEPATCFQNCTYLEDSPYTTHSGIHVYGSPWSPTFFDWAFNLDRGAPIREVWDKIPTSTDLLVTHGPPLGRGDLTAGNGRAGCYDLLVAVQQRIHPRVHVFGHIHEGAGVTFDGEVLYVNASNLNIKYQAVNYPVVIDIPRDPSLVARVVPPNCRLKSSDLVAWCRDNGFAEIGNRLEGIDPRSLPSGNDLLGQDAFDKLADAIGVFRDKDAAKALRNLQAKLYADSFPL